MILLFNKKSAVCTVIALCMVLAVGCSSTTKPLSTNVNNIRLLIQQKQDVMNW